MRTRGARRLYSRWREAKGDGIAPERGMIEPRALKEVLPWVFILDRVDREMSPFRLAGTGLCEFYGRELKAANFLSFWQGDCRRTARSLIDNVVMMPTPGVIDFEAWAMNERTLSGEILLLPLIAADGEVHQMLGGWFPLVTHDPMLEKPLLRQRIDNIRIIDHDDREIVPGDLTPPEQMPYGLRLVVSNGQMV